MKHILFLILLVLLFITTDIYAQVTIGSTFPPHKGSLLEIKEFDTANKEINATKGLGLPRVALESLSELTVDDESKKDQYAGLTVYNITNNAQLTEGIYCWFGESWKKVILMDTVGEDGNMLISKGDNTYKWEDVTIPGVKLYRPSQTAGFVTTNSVAQKYSWAQIMHSSQGADVYTSNPAAFTNSFLYTEKLKIETNSNNNKFMLIGLTADITKTTVNDDVVVTAFWEEVTIEILINNNVISPKKYIRSYSTAAKTPAKTTTDLFKIIPLPNTLNKGTYDLKIRISIPRTTYYSNRGTGNGNFNSPNQFVTIEMRDFGFVLYEER